MQIGENCDNNLGQKQYNQSESTNRMNRGSLNNFKNYHSNQCTTFNSSSSRDFIDYELTNCPAGCTQSMESGNIVWPYNVADCSYFVDNCHQQLTSVDKENEIIELKNEQNVDINCQNMPTSSVKVFSV